MNEEYEAYAMVLIFVWVILVAMVVFVYSVNHDVEYQKEDKTMPKAGFNDAFKKRLGRGPTQFIEEKLKAGSLPRDAEYEYELIAAEIERQSGYPAPPFSAYFDPYMVSAEQENPFTPDFEEEPAMAFEAEPIPQPISPKLEPPKNNLAPPAPAVKMPKTPETAVCIRELLYGRQFMETYSQSLRNLAHDKAFMQAIDSIHVANKEVEFADNPNNPAFKKFKIQTIPSAFAKNFLDMEPDYKDIEVDIVKTDHSPTSAKISVYYALRLYQICHQNAPVKKSQEEVAFPAAKSNG